MSPAPASLTSLATLRTLQLPSWHRTPSLRSPRAQISEEDSGEDSDYFASRSESLWAVINSTATDSQTEAAQAAAREELNQLIETAKKRRTKARTNACYAAYVATKAVHLAELKIAQATAAIQNELTYVRKPRQEGRGGVAVVRCGGGPDNCARRGAAARRRGAAPALPRGSSFCLACPFASSTSPLPAIPASLSVAGM